MSNLNRETILRMIADGKITAEEGMELLEALDAAGEPRPAPLSAAPKAQNIGGPVARPGQGKFLRVIAKIDNAESASGENSDIDVDVNLPIKMAHRIAPMLEQMIPEDAQDRMSQNGLDMATLVALLETLDEDMDGRDLVNVTIKGNDDEDKADIRVRIYVE